MRQKSETRQTGGVQAISLRSKSASLFNVVTIRGCEFEPDVSHYEILHDAFAMADARLVN